MKAFVKESLEMMGAQVAESADNALFVETPRGTKSQALFGGGLRHLLKFSAKSRNDGQLIVPGCQLLEELKFELSSIGSIRHGIYPRKIKFGRKDAKTKYTVFAGNVLKFSVRSRWHVTVRCHVKIELTGSEYIDDIVAIEIPLKGAPRLIKKIPGISAEVSWVEKPPMKRYRLQELIEKGLVFAEKVAIEKAEDLQADYLTHLYKTLKRLRSYYRQLKDDSTKKGNTNSNEVIPSGSGSPAEYSQAMIIKPDGSVEVPWITPQASELVLEIYNILNQKPFPVKVLKGNIYCG